MKRYFTNAPALLNACHIIRNGLGTFEMVRQSKSVDASPDSGGGDFEHLL
jgi:hypothetical protein